MVKSASQPSHPPTPQKSTNLSLLKLCFVNSAPIADAYKALTPSADNVQENLQCVPQLNVKLSTPKISSNLNVI